MYLINNINDFEELGIDSLIKLIKEDDLSMNKEELINYYRNHFLIEIGQQLEIIKSEKDNSIQSLKKVFNLFENIEELMIKNNSNIENFIDLMNLNEHPLAKSYIFTKNEKYLFLEDIISNIKNWEESGKNLLHSIKLFRMSPEGRKSITQKRKNYKISNLFDELLANYSVAQKAEIFTRIEKYIEFGWYSIDKPLEDYLKNNEGKDEAIKKLKTAMGSRFLKVKVQSEHIGGTVIEHSLLINEEEYIGDDIFEVSGVGFKDYALKSPDNKKIYIGDVTTQESGYNNGNSWTKTAKAALKYEKENPDIKVELTVSLIAMLYDTGNNSLVKSSFVEKLKEYNQNTVDDWNLIQFLSVLDRESFDAKYSFEEIFEKINVNFFGSTSELICNNILSNKVNFAENIMSLIERTLNNFGEYVFDAQRMETNSDSKALHLLLSTIKGFEKVICKDINLLNRYCLIKEPLKELAEKVFIGNGHISDELFRTAKSLDAMQIYDSYKERSDSQLKQHEMLEDIKIKKEIFLKNNENLINKLFDSLQKVVSSIENGYEPILKSQSKTWSGNYNDAFESIKINLKNAKEKGYLGCVNYNNQTIDKKDNVIKEAIVCISGLIRCSSRSSIMKNVENYLEELYKIVDKHFEFQTKNIKNTQNNYTNYGNFTIQLNANWRNHEEKVNEYYKNLKENVRKDIDDAINISKKLIDNSTQFELIKNKQIKPKI